MAAMVSEKILKEYGNNYFKLSSTYGGNTYEFDGVLTEIPSFSMSCSWDEGPVAGITDFVQETLSNELFEFAGIGTTNAESEYKRILPSDKMTALQYADVDFVSFDLKFRVYTAIRIGSHQFSPVKSIIGALAVGAMPNADMNVTTIGEYVDRALNNLGAAANGLAGMLRQGGAEENHTTMYKETIQGEAGGDMHNTAQKLMTNLVQESQNPGDGASGTTGNAREYLNAAVNQTNRTVFDNQNGKYGIVGAFIWNLTILPSFVKRPFPVMITNWSMTPSKEYNSVSQTHTYIDFSITCKVPQKLHNSTMLGHLRSATDKNA